MESKKDEIQEGLINELNSQFSQIMLASVRVGKCRVILRTIQKHSKNYIENPKILVLYPNIDIKISWQKECEIINYHPNITYCTFISIDKVKDDNWDYVVCDEAHLIPEENILPKIGELVKRHANTLLASGTYNSDTLENLENSTGLKHIINYSTEQAIKDGIVCNYNVYIHQYKLDGITKKTFGKVKKWESTELKECNRLSNKVNTTSGQERFFHALNRMRFINSCNSLINCVNKWIESHKNFRFILFTGDENVGKNYKLPMYNSKSKDNSVLLDFQQEKINQLCLIRKGSQGVTYPNLSTILLTAINSNGENLEQQIGRGLLDDTEDVSIHIFVSDEQFQQKWLSKALEKIPTERIKYINI